MIRRQTFQWLGAAAAAAYGAWQFMRVRRRIELDDKRVLITGGARGLGLALARELTARGARLAIVARSTDQLARVRDELRSVSVIARDLTEPGQPTAAVEDAVRELDGLDVLINNAGIIDVGPVEQMDTSAFEAAMRVHFWAPLEATVAALPHLERERAGRVVNIASIGGEISVPHMAPYSASKFALVGLSDALRAELAGRGVRVTTVCPGLMRTGSHINASFRGKHEAEYAWFVSGAAAPLLSMPAEKAARRIVRALRYGDPHLTLGAPARVASVANSVAPNMTAEIMALVARLLPAPSPEAGTRSWSGWDSRGREPRWFGRRADREIEPHNEHHQTH